MRRTDLESSIHDCIILDTLNLRENVRLVGFYRPFKIPENISKQAYLDGLLDCIGKAHKPTRFIAGGDINIDYNPQKSSQELDTLTEWLIEVGLMQLVEKNTRHRLVFTDGNMRLETSLLDHVYSNDKPKITCLETGYSDHEVIILEINRGLYFGKKVKHMVRDWRKYCRDSLEDMFEKATETDNNVMDALTSILQHLAPYRVVRTRENSGQVVDTRIEKLKKRRDRLYKKYKSENYSTKKKMEYLFESKELSKRIKKEVKISIKKAIHHRILKPSGLWLTNY